MGKASRLKKERQEQSSASIARSVGAVRENRIGQKLGKGASRIREIKEMEWISQVGAAVIRDDVEAFNLLVEESLYPVLDIEADMSGTGDSAQCLSLMEVASNLGSVKCLEQLCFIAASTGNLEALGQLNNVLYTRYESEEDNKSDIERMILAMLNGAENGFEGAVPSIYLSLSLSFPSAIRFAMISMADRLCSSVAAPAYEIVHNENKRKVFGAMARGDSKAINFHLCRTQFNLQENASLMISKDEVKLFFQVAAACGRPESIVAAFKTLRGFQDDLGKKGVVLALLMAGLEELSLTVNRVRKPWLDKAVKDCVELAVIEDRKLGETILGKTDTLFLFSIDAAKSGALAAIAELDRREISSHVEMQEVIKLASSKVRI